MRKLTEEEKAKYWKLDELQVPLSFLQSIYVAVIDGDSEFHMFNAYRLPEDLNKVVAIYTKSTNYLVFGYKVIPVNIWLGDIVEEEEQAVSLVKAEEYSVGDRVLVKNRYHIGHDSMGIDDDTLDDICGSYRSIVAVKEGVAVQLMGDLKRYWWPLFMIDPAGYIVKTDKAKAMPDDTDYINKGPSPYKLYKGPRIGEIRKEFKRR